MTHSIHCTSYWLLLVGTEEKNQRHQDRAYSGLSCLGNLNLKVRCKGCNISQNQATTSSHPPANSVVLAKRLTYLFNHVEVVAAKTVNMAATTNQGPHHTLLKYIWNMESWPMLNVHTSVRPHTKPCHC